MSYSCNLFFFFIFFFQTLISVVTERITFILSHNIQSGCNLIMHPQEFVDVYPTEKSPKTPKNYCHLISFVWLRLTTCIKQICYVMGIWETESVIRWQITLQ